MDAALRSAYEDMEDLQRHYDVLKAIADELADALETEGGNDELVAKYREGAT